MVSPGGVAAAAASAGFNGSFGLFQKLPRIQHAQVSMHTEFELQQPGVTLSVLKLHLSISVFV